MMGRYGQLGDNVNARCNPNDMYSHLKLKQRTLGFVNTNASPSNFQQYIASAHVSRQYETTHPSTIQYVAGNLPGPNWAYTASAILCGCLTHASEVCGLVGVDIHAGDESFYDVWRCDMWCGPVTS